MKTWERPIIWQERLKRPFAYIIWQEDNDRTMALPILERRLVYICMSVISSNFSTFSLSQLVLFKCLEWIKHPTKQGSHVDHYERMKFPLLISATPKERTEMIHMLFSKQEMESESPDQHFFFHLAFFSLIFIIVITFKQFTWNGHGNEINSCHPLFLLPKHCCAITKFAQEN